MVSGDPCCGTLMSPWADPKQHFSGAGPCHNPSKSAVDRIYLKTLGRTLRDLTKDGVKSRERHRTPDWTRLQSTIDTEIVTENVNCICFQAQQVTILLIRFLLSPSIYHQYSFPSTASCISRSESDELHTSKPSHSISITFIIAIRISKRALKM